MNKLHRSIGLASLLGGVAAAATGCGSSTSSATAAEQTPTVTVTQTATNSVTATTSASPADTTTASTVPSCSPAHLSLALGRGQGAAGHVIYPLRFTNTGSGNCQLAGFPGVSFVTGAQGTQVGAAATRTGPAGSPVTLQPGGSATAKVSVTSTGPYPQATCKPVKVNGFRVYPPGSTEATFVANAMTVCSNPSLNTLSVEAVTAR